MNKVRELIRADELGEIYFITSSRMNLGLYQQDGVVLDLAPHDLSILLHWLGKPLVEVTANGRSVFQEGVHETAFLTLRFEGGTQANVQLSWLAPRKMRQMVVVGSRRMVQYEDTAADDSVRIYDRGLDFAEPPANFGEYRLTYRTGDMVAPRIEASSRWAGAGDFASAIRRGHARLQRPLGVEIVLAWKRSRVAAHPRRTPADSFGRRGCSQARHSTVRATVSPPCKPRRPAPSPRSPERPEPAVTPRRVGPLNRLYGGSEAPRRRFQPARAPAGWPSASRLASRALRSNLPFALSGSSSRARSSRGTMYSGSAVLERRRAASRSSGVADEGDDAAGARRRRAASRRRRRVDAPTPRAARPRSRRARRGARAP